MGVSGDTRSEVYRAPEAVSATRQIPYPGDPAFPRAGSEYIWIRLGGRTEVKTVLADVARRVVICAGSFVDVAIPRMAVMRRGCVKCSADRFCRGDLDGEMK